MADDQILDPVVINSDNSQQEVTPSNTGDLTLAPPPEVPVQDTKLTLAPPDSTQTPSLNTVDKRTSQFQYGLKNVVNLPDDDIRERIQSSQESLLRDKAAMTLNYTNQMKKQDMITDLANKKGGPLTPDEVNYVLNPSAAHNKPVNPADVVERAWAHTWLSTLDTASQYMENSVWNDAQKEIPARADELRNRANDLISKIKIAGNLSDDIADDIAHQGWIGWSIDQAKSLFQPYTELKLRGTNPDVGFFSGGIGLGTNIKAQADDLLNSTSSVDEFNDKLTSIITPLRKDNPTLAKQFVDYIVGKSASDRYLDNIFTAVAPADILSVGELGLKGARLVSVNNRASKLFKDITKASAEVETEATKSIPVTAVNAEARGDVKEGAVIQAADNFDKTMTGTAQPVTDSIKSDFFKYFRGIAGDLDTNVGSSIREQRVRLQNSIYDTANGLWDALNRITRITRTPGALTSEDALRAHAEATARDYKGVSNQVADIGNPVRERVTNTFWNPVEFHDTDGALFRTAEQAKANAELNGHVDIKINQVADGPEKVKDAFYVGKKIDIRRVPELERTLEDLPSTIDKHKEALSKATTDVEKKAIRSDIRSMQTLQKQYIKDLAEARSRLTKMPAEINQHGNGYSYTVWVPYKEADPITRSFTISSSGGDIYDASGKLASDVNKSAISPLGQELNNENTRTWFKGWASWFRGAEDTLAVYDKLNRKLVSSGQNVINELLRNEAKKIEAVYTGKISEDAVTGAKIPWWQAKARQYIGKVTQSEVGKQFDQVLDFSRRLTNPATGKPGYFFKNVGDLEDYYQWSFQRLPTPAETEAYFTHVKLVEVNRVMSEISEFRYRARLGAEQHNIFTVGKDGVRTQSGFFDGINQKKYPGGTKGFVLVMEDDGNHKLYPVQNKNAYTKKVASEIESGQRKAVRIYDPDSFPLKDFSDLAGYNRVRYVIAKNVETKPLDFNHVTRQEGGHFDYEYDAYIKQAQLRHDDEISAEGDKRNRVTSWYTGDTTVMPIGNRALGRKVLGHLENVRNLIAKNQLDVAEAYTKEHLPMPWSNGRDGVKEWFQGGRDEKGRIMPPRLDVNEPFRIVNKNQSIWGLDNSLETRYKNFEDAFQSGSDAKQWKVAYNQERDANGIKTVNDIGTQGNPIYTWEPAKMVNPTVSMNRALQRAVASTFMDDYKISAVEHWLQEAAPLLKLEKSELESSPFYHFNSINDKAFKPDVPAWAVNNLLQNRQKILQFTGIQSNFDKYVHGIAQTWADKFYEAYGPEENRSGLAKLTLLPMHLIGRSKDPIQVLRSYAFNSKLGLFNPVQLAVQAQSHALIVSMEPRRGVSGMWAQALHQVSRLNQSEEVLNHLDNMATKFNVFGVKFKPGEWKEARKLLEDTGFDKVSGEVTFRDDQLNYKFIGSEFSNFLDAGQIFFREGEKSPRLSAWYTSYRKFRDENPTGPISELDKAKILDYADLLNNNMTRASKSNLEHGVFSLSSQFLSYQLRSMELMLGKRLGDTTGQRALARARILTGYSMIYGVPSAIGVTGWPFGDNLRQYALDHGYVVGDNWVTSLIGEGVPAITMAIITGKGDYQAGDWYNIGARYGSQGMTQIRDALSADGAFMKVVTGAGGSTFYNQITNLLDPIMKGYRAMVNGEDVQNPVKPSDLLNIFNEVSTYQTIKKTKYALNTGRWVSNNGAFQEDVTSSQALFRAITGLTSQDQSDNFQRSKISEATKDDFKSAQKEANKYVTNWLDALQNNDSNEAARQMTLYQSMLIAEGIPPQQRSKIWELAVKNAKPQIEHSMRSFSDPNYTTTDKAQSHNDAYNRWLELQEKRRNR